MSLTATATALLTLGMLHMSATNAPNIDPDTGIAYGYISGNTLNQDIVDKLLFGPQAVNKSQAEGYNEWLTSFKYAREEKLLSDPNTAHLADDAEQLDPKQSDINEFWEDWVCEEPYIEGVYRAIKYATAYMQGSVNFFILHSPHVTDSAREASPCVPNAGILDKLNGYTKAYNVPIEWRADPSTAQSTTDETNKTNEADSL